MSFLSKLFGKKSEPVPTSPPASPAPPGAPKIMKVWDEYGRVGEIPREEWRTKVLPHNFRANWNNPNALANLIHNALFDGFISDCLEPARQLHQIDTEPKRGATLFAMVLLQLKKYDEAERIITEAINRHGEDGSLLTNLAKAQNGKGNTSLSERTLWHALEVDPNLDNGLLWYQAIHRDRGGDSAGLESLKRVAALPGSWRAQLWIAREALKARKLDEALTLYRESLNHAGNSIPVDLLQQVSGDLGNAGHLPEILQLIAPYFDAKTHGLSVGNNLVEACVDLGQLDAAGNILDQLYKQNRGDWKERLSFWDTEIAKVRVSLHEADKEMPPAAMLGISGPVWLSADSPAVELFPAKTNHTATFALIGSAAEIITNSKRTQHQMSDAPGRMTRALPLFLAEQLEFRTNSRVETLIPWLTGNAPAFVFSGGAWTDEDAASYARQGQNKSDYVVTLFLRPNSEPWSVELRLVRTIDGKLLGTQSGSFTLAQSQAGIPELANKLIYLLRDHADIMIESAPTDYQIPLSHLGNYLLRLEQLLAIRCTAMDKVHKNFLSGEREIIDGNLQLCLDFPSNVNVRVLFFQTLRSLNRVRPDIVTEYREKVTRLQEEKPLKDPAHSVIQRLVNELWTV